MSDVMVHWDQPRLDEVCTYIQRGKSPKYTTSSALPVVNQRCVRWWGLDVNHFKYIDPAQWESWSEERFLRQGDVLWNSTGAGTLGRACRFTLAAEYPKLVVDTHVTIVRPGEALSSAYLFYYVMSPFVQKKITDMQTGSTNQVELPRAAIAATRIPLAPLREQQRIVSRIEELFSAVDEGERALKRAQKLVERYRQSVLKAAVTGELTRGWRAAHALIASQQPEAKGPFALPPGWLWTTIDRAGEVRLGRQRAPQHHQGDHMRPYLRVANVYEDRLDLTDVKEMNFTPKEFETYALRPGDILLNEGQSPELVGRPAMYRDEIPGCCYQKTLLRFRARPGVLPDFALLVFRHYLHSGRFRRSANITTSIAHLAAERFEPIEFPLPPESEQAAIIDSANALLGRLTHLEAELLNQQSASRALREATLKAAFSGELVPQDPSDEPASALLARLAAEPGGASAAPRRRGRPIKQGASNRSAEPAG